MIDLKVDEPALIVRINYPGPNSDVCGLKLSTSFDLPFWEEQESFAKKIIVSQGKTDTDGWEPIFSTLAGHNHSALTYELPFQNLFIGYVQIKTVDGQSLKAVIDEVFGPSNSLLVFTAARCRSKQ
jgi:hypothetical protein